ncbi:uncharacterized protein LOC131303811 isoform X2 [Rhododendron vialii]|uniref:uncharacterized protein LOC131303811 isoform X2 n=1 Tax=Rhododendron vialii TaxID=182163 RepID=UPI00265DE4B6|nr:uncharacterized protein LOC131303811 isoform X2 [Rhododendron vialii]XP_058186840.1 uncharacterized protein LOC131303811 isoform X2 [Rhododendron vialii]
MRSLRSSRKEAFHISSATQRIGIQTVLTIDGICCFATNVTNQEHRKDWIIILVTHLPVEIQDACDTFTSEVPHEDDFGRYARLSWLEKLNGNSIDLMTNMILALLCKFMRHLGSVTGYMFRPDQS